METLQIGALVAGLLSLAATIFKGSVAIAAFHAENQQQTALLSRLTQTMRQLHDRLDELHEDIEELRERRHETTGDDAAAAAAVLARHRHSGQRRRRRRARQQTLYDTAARTAPPLNAS